MMGHHAKVDHDSIDEMMTRIAQASESLKWITHGRRRGRDLSLRSR